MNSAQQVLKLTREAEVPPAPKQVPGGVVTNVEITPAEYKSETNNMRSILTIRVKRWNSLFNIMKNPYKEEYHVFHLMFSENSFKNGAVNPERSERIKYIGVFNSKDAAVNYLNGGSAPSTLLSNPDNKSIEIGGKRETPWTNQELGVGNVQGPRSAKQA